MQVLVTGATGALGPRVVEALLAAGYTVRVLVRRPPQPAPWSPMVDVVVGDITDPAAVKQAVAGCEGVCHLAALLHINNPAPALQAEYERINVTGTANVLAAAQADGVQRVVFFSTIAVYGHGHRMPVTEATPPQPDSLYGATKLAAEQLVLAARRVDGQPLGVILRLAAVYGTRVKGNYQRLLTALRKGRFFPIGAGTNHRTLVYDRDVAAAALLALQHPAAAGQTYNVTDGSVHTLQEIIEAICQALNRRPPSFHIPVLPVRLLVGLVEGSLALVGRSSPIGRATLEKYLEEMTVDGQKLQQSLGFTPRYALTAGWAEVVYEQGIVHP